MTYYINEINFRPLTQNEQSRALQAANGKSGKYIISSDFGPNLYVVVMIFGDESSQFDDIYYFHHN